MKTISKHIIIFSGFSIFLFLGYTALQNTNIQSSQSDETNKSLSQSNSGTHTGISLNRASQSGGEWGNNPFATGTTSSGNIKKLEFVKPNTEWKTRTLSGITYVFGEGNPKEVALSESEMKGCSYQEGGDYCTDNGAGYVDPILEKIVYDLLTSPDWIPLLQNCENDFRIVESFIQNSHPFVNYISYNNLIHLGQYISMEEIFIINPQTGRKNITKEGYWKLMSIYGYIQWSSDTFNRGGLGNPLPGITQCVDTYGINIANKLINIRWMPWRGSNALKEWDDKLLPL
jgi:hypothetical protein